MHMARGFSVLYHVFARNQYAFSVLHYVLSVALLYSMLHRFEIFSASGTIAQCSIRLPRGFSFAIIIMIIIITIIIIFLTDRGCRAAMMDTDNRQA